MTATSGNDTFSAPRNWTSTFLTPTSTHSATKSLNLTTTTPTRVTSSTQRASFTSSTSTSGSRNSTTHGLSHSLTNSTTYEGTSTKVMSSSMTSIPPRVTNPIWQISNLTNIASGNWNASDSRNQTWQGYTQTNSSVVI